MMNMLTYSTKYHPEYLPFVSFTLKLGLWYPVLATHFFKLWRKIAICQNLGFNS